MEAEQIQVLSRVNGNLDLVILDDKSIVPVIFYFQILHVTYLLIVIFKLHLLLNSLRNDLFFFLILTPSIIADVNVKEVKKEGFSNILSLKYILQNSIVVLRGILYGGRSLCP